MKNVYTFLLTNWRFFFGFVLIIIFARVCINVFQRFNKTAERIYENININRKNENIEHGNKLLSKVETLQTKDSIIQEKIKEIDSLRTELGGLNTDIDELYKFLSNRYDKNPKR